MTRVIFHSDANSFYASVECLYDPDLRMRPVAVCGDPHERHGIVLTANPIAKSFGVRTGQAVWQAQQICPDLVAVKPDYPLYLHFSQMLRDLYDQYTDHVEAFGLDECWLDVSRPGLTPQEAVPLADELRRRVREELGITVSVGVSYNKVFAKLASDLKKPDATTLISSENYQQVAWPQPVGALLFVGPQTQHKLREFGILTIGDLAQADPAVLRSRLGKNGETLRAFALGQDSSRVLRSDLSMAVKSIGNSTTPPHDIATLRDARCLFYLLAEGVGARLREQGLRCRCVSVWARRTDLRGFTCQQKLERSTSRTGDLAQAAIQLFEQHLASQLPLRSAGLTCQMLEPESLPVQMDLLGQAQRDLRRDRLERALDGLRKRYGHQVVQRGIVLEDPDYSRLNPKEDNTMTFKPFYR